MFFIYKLDESQQQEKLNREFLDAVSEHNFKKAKALLSEGADIRATDAGGNTAFHKLAGNAYKRKESLVEEFVCLLLNQGLDINTPNKEGRTCLHVVIENAKAWPWHAGFTGYNICTPLELARSLLSCGACAVKDNSGATPLHLAAFLGNQEKVDLFLFRVDQSLIAVQDNDGKYPHDYAKEGGYHTLSQSLLKKFEAYRSETATQEDLAEEKPAAIPDDGWTLRKPEVIEHAGDLGGYRLTEIFNFHTRLYTQIMHNHETGQDALAVKSFDDFPDKTLFVEAHEALTRLGGKADAGAIHRAILNKGVVSLS